MANINITHKLVDGNNDFSDLIKHHSGDKTIPYKVVNGEELLMSWFFPKDYSKDKKYPVMIYIHGGGWNSREIMADETSWQGDYFGVNARHDANNGFVAVSVSYRLEREHAEGYQIIDCCDDCFDAVDYILDHAQEYAIDTENVYVIGESAGGHLAGLLATDYKRDGFKFKAAFLGNPVLYFEGDPDFCYIPSSSTHPVWSKMDPKDYARSISPLFHITPDTCPCILIHGAADTCVNPNHSTLFFEKMCEAGLECELHLIENTNHAFMLAEFTDNQNACRIAMEIVDDRLRRDGNLK